MDHSLNTSGSSGPFESDESVLSGHKKSGMWKQTNSNPLNFYVCICISMGLVLCFPVPKEESELKGSVHLTFLCAGSELSDSQLTHVTRVGPGSAMDRLVVETAACVCESYEALAVVARPW